MSSGPVEELSVPFDAGQAQQKVARRRRAMWSRLVSLVLTAAILAGIYFWRGDRLTGPGFGVLSAVVLGVSLAWFLGCLVAYLRAKRVRASVGSGIALRVGRAGVEMTGTFVPWRDVGSLGAVQGRLGRSPELRLIRALGEPLSVPFDQIAVSPATLDLTVRAYSGGRHGVDLEALES